MKNISFFRELNYDLVVRRTQNGYIVSIPELSLSAEDSQFEDALRKLNKRVETHFKHLLEQGRTNEIVLPGGRIKGGRKDLISFAIKGAGILLICLILIRALHNTAVQIPHKALQLGLNSLKSTTHQFESMAEDEKQAARIRIKALLIDLKPYMQDFRAVLLESEQLNTDNTKN